MVIGIFIIVVVSFVVGLLFINIFLLVGLDFYGLFIVVLVVSGLVLLLGYYWVFDCFFKFLVVLFILFMGVVVVLLLICGFVGDVVVSWVSIDFSFWILVNLVFLIFLMGWMFGLVEMCVWLLLWMFFCVCDIEYIVMLKEVEFDFNFGYGVIVVMVMFSIIFICLDVYFCSIVVI